MVPIYKEASFRTDYRQAQVGQIMAALYRLRSIAVTGLAGMGKSNVVRFIVSHPQVRSRYLKDRADDYTFVHVDCAGLAGSDEAEILSEIVAHLHREGFPAEAGPPSPIHRTIRHLLRDQILSVDARLNLVLVLDYFDELARELGRPFFNYLFHLRNVRPRGNLSYVFVTRRPMGHLHELQELLDDGCIIGPLSYRDALDSIRRDEARLGCTLDPERRDDLIACTGGHPGWMKNSAELACSGKVDLSAPAEESARQLLRSEKVRNLCEELWNDLTATERPILANATRHLPLTPSVDTSCVTFLERNGILVRKDGARDGQDLAVFCPLFETFVRQATSTGSAIRITAVFPNQVHVETPAGEEWTTLPPRVFAALLALTEAQGQVVPTDEMIHRVYGDEAAGATNAALSQLVKRLRGALDPRVRRMIDDPGYTCVETIRDVGYRLNG
jgi:DNA-binding winged helix-turn-helix (wHTH) protein